MVATVTVTPPDASHSLLDRSLSLVVEFTGDADFLDGSRRWIANGSRGVRHVARESGADALCSSFSSRSSARLTELSVTQARQGSCCEDCLSLLVSTTVSRGGLRAAPLFALALKAQTTLDQVDDLVDALPTELVTLRLQARLVGQQLAASAASDLPLAPPVAMLMDRLERSLRDVDAALTSRIADASSALHEQSVRAAMIPPFDGAYWLAQPEEFELLGFAAHVPQSGPRMILIGYLDDLAAGVPVAQARREALTALTSVGLRSLEQVSRVPVDLVASSAVSSAASSTQTFEALSSAWRAHAERVATVMVDRWQARLEELTEATDLVRFALLSGVDPQYWDELLQVARESSTVMGPSTTTQVPSVVFEVTRATALALLTRVHTPGEAVGSPHSGVYGAVVPDGLDERTVETALALWDPWDPASQFVLFSAAVLAARALLAQDPPVASGVRRVRLDAARAASSLPPGHGAS